MSELPEPGRRRSIAAPVAAIALLIGAGVVLWSLTSPETGRRTWPAEFASAGQQLYFTGRSPAGTYMTPRGGNHHRTMMGSGGCADCHGTDRRGGRLWPNFWQVAPSLTADALTGDHQGDGHSHETYTAETLARAIAQGIRPDGSTIGAGMPRWTISAPDMDALVSFLLAH